MKEDKIIFSPRAVAQAQGKIPEDYVPEKRRLNGAPKTATLKKSSGKGWKPSQKDIKLLRKKSDGVFITAPDSKHNLIKVLVFFEGDKIRVIQTEEPFGNIAKNTTLYKNVMLCLEFE